MQLLISEEEILKKVHQASLQIQKDYVDKEILIILVMKGSLCFVADLIRCLPAEMCTIDFIQCKSYGLLGAQRADLEVIGLERIECEGKHVLLVDDIFDSGSTLKQLSFQIAEKKPASLKSMVLLSKQSREVSGFKLDYALFAIEDVFVVGYGLDYKEHYRGLRSIYKIEGYI